MKNQLICHDNLKSALRKGASLTARNAISLLCRAATSTVAMRSGSLAELIAEHSSGGPFLFLPYGSPDCLALHAGISKALQSKGLVSVHDQNVPSFDLSKYIIESAHPQSFAQFQEKLSCLLANSCLADLYYPVLDTIISFIPYNLFESGIDLSPSFFDALYRHYCYLEKICQNFQACFLADTAYLNNQAIKQIMIKSGKTAFYLNPRGQLKRYNGINYGESNSRQSSVTIGVLEENRASKYLAKRFAGKSRRDLDSASSFNQSTSIKVPNKKVLFLHCFRDANNTSWKRGQVFDSYYEWVDYTFSVISEARQFEDWYIKPHPSRRYYRDDEAILGQLIVKHRIPLECMRNVPNTSDVLASQMPIYTNNGTIVLEAASLGQAAYFCGPSHDPSFGHQASSKDEWAMMLLQSKLISDRIGIQSTRLARYSLWKYFEAQNIVMLCPSRPVMPMETSIHKIAILLGQICNSLTCWPSVVEIPQISP